MNRLPLAALAAALVGCSGTVLVHDDNVVAIDDAGTPGQDASAPDGAPPEDAGPPPPTSLRSISLGTSHSCAVPADGTLRCWGHNSSCELMHGAGSLSEITPQVAPGLPEVRAVATGRAWTCALSADGRVWCAGSNTHGQLGNGTLSATEFVCNPAPVTGLEGAVGIAANELHACAVTADGHVRCWGWDQSGQVSGKGFSGSEVLQPSTVHGIDQAVEVAVAYNSSCARLSNGEVWCWGEPSDFGIAGYQELPPTKMPLPPTAQLASGQRHYVVLAQDSTVWFWGRPTCGGALDCEGTWPPVPVPSAWPAKWVGGGVGTACAGRADGTVWCWGALDQGSMLDGGHCGWSDAVPQSIPSFQNADMVRAGDGFACSSRPNGTVACLGLGHFGQTGNGGADCVSAKTVTW